MVEIDYDKHEKRKAAFLRVTQARFQNFQIQHLHGPLKPTERTSKYDTSLFNNITDWEYQAFTDYRARAYWAYYALAHFVRLYRQEYL